MIQRINITNDSAVITYKYMSSGHKLVVRFFDGLITVTLGDKREQLNTSDLTFLDVIELTTVINDDVKSGIRTFLENTIGVKL